MLAKIFYSRGAISRPFIDHPNQIKNVRPGYFRLVDAYNTVPGLAHGASHNISPGFKIPYSTYVDFSELSTFRYPGS